MEKWRRFSADPYFLSVSLRGFSLSRGADTVSFPVPGPPEVSYPDSFTALYRWPGLFLPLVKGSYLLSLLSDTPPPLEGLGEKEDEDTWRLGDSFLRVFLRPGLLQLAIGEREELAALSPGSYPEGVSFSVRSYRSKVRWSLRYLPETIDRGGAENLFVPLPLRPVLSSRSPEELTFLALLPRPSLAPPSLSPLLLSACRRSWEEERPEGERELALQVIFGRWLDLDVAPFLSLLGKDPLVALLPSRPEEIDLFDGRSSSRGEAVFSAFLSSLLSSPHRLAPVPPRSLVSDSVALSHALLALVLCGGESPLPLPHWRAGVVLPLAALRSVSSPLFSRLAAEALSLRPPDRLLPRALGAEEKRGKTACLLLLASLS